jgi:hypothetical protein
MEQYLATTVELGQPVLSDPQVRFRPSPIRTTPALHNMPPPVPIGFCLRNQSFKVR